MESTSGNPNAIRESVSSRTPPNPNDATSGSGLPNHPTDTQTDLEGASASVPTRGTMPKKRKPMQPRSDVWQHFTKVCLHDWWLMKSQGEDGITLAGIDVRGKEPHSFFQSAAIIKRYDSCILEASDGCMIYICGFINRVQMRQNDFPAQFCSHFLTGFPYDWEDFVAQYFSGRLKEGRNDPLPVLHKLSVPHVRDLLMSVNKHEVDREFGKHLSEDLISGLMALPGDSSVTGTATEQSPEDQNADIAVARMVNELGKDCSDEKLTASMSCTREKIDMEMPNKRTFVGENGLNGSSSKLGNSHSDDVSEATGMSQEDANDHGCPPERYGRNERAADSEKLDSFVQKSSRKRKPELGAYQMNVISSGMAEENINGQYPLGVTVANKMGRSGANKRSDVIEHLLSVSRRYTRSTRQSKVEEAGRKDKLLDPTISVKKGGATNAHCSIKTVLPCGGKTRAKRKGAYPVSKTDKK